MSLQAMLNEIETLGDKDEFLDVSALRLASMRAIVVHHERLQSSAWKKSAKIWKHAESEQQSRKNNK